MTTTTTTTDSPRHTARLVLTTSASDEFVYDFNNDLGVVKKCPACPHRYYDYRTPKEQCVSCGNWLIVVVRGVLID